ncbi:MAG TPA: ABC transporter permease [Vicinamibacterales bacterium]|nr:ABC transporter permease [Vicinamibacterales bacterium]
MISDLRFAVRMLLHSRGFTVTALVVLTLGIGATTTMFSATNAVLLRPLPYPDPDRMVAVRETRAQAGFEKTIVSLREYVAWTRDSRVLTDATIVDYPGLAVAIDNTAVRLGAMRVSAEFFPLFGVTPIAGRAFARDAEQPGNADVVLISSKVWQERFAGAADVVGRLIRVEGRPTTVIGILPASFSFMGAPDLIVPMSLSPERLRDTDHAYDVYARLAPGVTPAQATEEVSRIAAATEDGPVHLTGATLVPLRQEIVGDAETPMLVMFGAVGFVLLIACANIANLLLARGASRQREMAIRAALGAGRARIVRQLLTESLLLSAAGGVAGALLATWLTELLARAAAGSIPRADEIHVDARTLIFALGIAIVAGLVFGLVPAWQAARTDVNDTLKAEGRGTSSARQRALGVCVVAEVALAMVLLVGASLLLATFGHLKRLDPGFDAAHALVVPAFLPAWKYPTAEARRTFFERATRELAAVPGVTAVGATNALPLSGDNSSGSLTIEGRPAPAPATRPNADRRSITPGYHDALAIRLQGGRLFTAADDQRAPLVVIVSRGFADRYWPGENALGKRVKLARFETEAPWRTVVGIVNDVQHKSLGDRPRPVAYYPHAQGPDGDMQLVVRAAAAPGAIAGGVREAMQRIDADLPVTELKPMTAFLSGALGDTEVALSLLGSFALMALTLAAAGIYGVMAYAVAQRRLEFGIRLALGAAPRDLVRLVGVQSLRLTLVGIVLGLAGAWLTSSLLGDLVVGVGTTDARVFAATAAFLATVALAACVVPALRATRVDPNQALRAQ